MSQSTQRSRILALLIGARGREVGLPEILALHISQFGARIKELRALGFCIQNRQEHHGGQTHSWYRLTSNPTPTPVPPSDREDDQLFPEDTPRRHLDLG